MFNNYPVFNYVFITLLFEETPLEPSSAASLSNDSLNFHFFTIRVCFVLWSIRFFFLFFRTLHVPLYNHSMAGGREGNYDRFITSWIWPQPKTYLPKFTRLLEESFCSFGSPEMSTELAYSLKFNLLLVWLNYLSCEADISFIENSFCLFSSV